MFLAIDTSLGTSAAVIDEYGETLSEVVNLDPLGHVEALAKQLHSVMELSASEFSGFSRESLTGVVVGIGPGPFTGLRVGIAAAKGFATGLALPLHAVCSLDALALQLYSGDLNAFRAVRPAEFSLAKRSAASELSEDSVQVPTRAISRPQGSETVQLVTDARRREVFTASYAGLTEAGLPIRLNDLSLLGGVDVPASAITADWLSAASVARYAQLALSTRQKLPDVQAIYLRQPDVTLSAPKRVTS